MTAREMFKKLGFEQTLNDSDFIIYEKVEAESCHTRFMFALESRSFEAIFYIDGYGVGGYFIELDEFKVILKQMEELGWIEEEKQEIKQETNFEHYKDEILEDYSQNLAVVKGRPTLCYKTNCNDCYFKINQIGCRQKAKEWLNKPYEKPKYKFTQFEYDLINTYRHVDDRCKFNGFYQLKSLKEKGYFKNVDKNESIKDILANCEVIK